MEPNWEQYPDENLTPYQLAKKKYNLKVEEYEIQRIKELSFLGFLECCDFIDKSEVRQKHFEIKTRYWQEWDELSKLRAKVSEARDAEEAVNEKVEEVAKEVEELKVEETDQHPTKEEMEDVV